MDRSMIDATSGGALMDKTPVTVRLLISNMASNTQRLENQLTELTSLVRQLAVGQHQPIVQRVCGICASVEHLTDMCPTLQESETKTISEAIVPAKSKSSATYNTKGPRYQAPPFYQQQHQQLPLQENNLVGKLADTVSQLQSAGSRTIPSQTILNPTGGGVDMTQLRSDVAKRSEIDEDLLKLSRKVEINILLLDAIKQVPKYAKFLKELYVHKRKKMNGVVEMGGVVSSLV
ncbi:hypothetical protein CR513_31632, partial [Mucuna pruriens]